MMTAAHHVPIMAYQRHNAVFRALQSRMRASCSQFSDKQFRRPHGAGLTRRMHVKGQEAASRDDFPARLDGWAREFLVAWGITSLTDIQREAVEAGILDEKSMVVCSPTSSGKTLVAEMALLAAIRRGHRAVYLVSHRALAEQKFADFDSRLGEKAARPIASVGLSTGDRSDGAANAQVLVATYEKALGLLLTGEIRPAGSLIVADELQIIGEEKRGPDIEVLCTVLRQRAPAQFVALTATISNPEELAEWLGCDVIRSTERVVPLHQEIWMGTRRWCATFGEADVREIAAGPALRDTFAVVRSILASGRGPILVFTETRRESTDFAREFAESRQVTAAGVAVAEQLDLFTEPTDSSALLRTGAERRVAFHSADLSSHERQIIEDGFKKNHFEVCFATSTLAAGVNFPFRTVVFPKITYQHRDGRLSRTDYRNMSGRAGRLGIHVDGYAVLLPTNAVELEHAKVLVRPEDDNIVSQLGNISIRKTLLSIFASRIVQTAADAIAFFESTLLYSQRTPGRFTSLPGMIDKAVRWLIDHQLVVDRGGGAVSATPLGKAVAQSGLQPDSAITFVNILRASAAELERSFDDRSDGLIYVACACQEFQGELATRFLPFPRRTLYDSVGFWHHAAPWATIDDTDTKLAQCAHAIQLFKEGIPEKQISQATAVSAGNIHRLAGDVAWVLDGVHKISCAPELRCLQGVSNQIAALARRVRWGAPAEALDVIRVSERHRVPGLGRQRAMALLSAGIETFHKVLEAPIDLLARLLQSAQRANALVEAICGTDGLGTNRLQAQHQHVAEKMGMGALVDECNRATGTAYEEAVIALMRRATDWTVDQLDDGSRRNVPDIMIRHLEFRILLECKTSTRNPALVKKEDAWAVMQKAADYEAAFCRVTLGKPAFDESSKKKAAGARDITLIEHAAFIEGILRVVSGNLPPTDFLAWAITPGVADLERLGGTPTHSL